MRNPVMEDSLDDPARRADSAKPRREPPTIDLEASDVTEKTASPAGGNKAHDGGDDEAKPSTLLSALPQFLAAGITGAVTAAVVIATAWAIGWPRDTPPGVAKTEVNASAIEALSSRLSE